MIDTASVTALHALAEEHRRPDAIDLLGGHRPDDDATERPS